jgi:hypothetical protein
MTLLNGKRCGHTRYTLHLGQLVLDERYFSKKCTYLGCETRMAASPKFLQSLSAELRQAKVEQRISDDEFASLIDAVSKKITTAVKLLCPTWATSTIAYDAALERQMASIAKREKAYAVELLRSKDIGSYIGAEQLPLFAEMAHSVYLKTVDCHWEDAAHGPHWFKYGHSKDPTKRYAGEQVTLDQEQTFGLVLPIHTGQGRLFEQAIKRLIVEQNITTPEGNDALKKREKFYAERRTALELFNRAYKEFSI